MIAVWLLGILVSTALATDVLVLFDNADQSARYKQLVSLIERRGFTVVTMAADDAFNIFLHGERQYKSILLMAPAYTFKEHTVNEFVKFVDDGGNLLVGLDHGYSTQHQSLLYALDMEADAPSSDIVDDKHTVSVGIVDYIFTDNVTTSKVLFDEKIQRIVYSGVALHVPPSPLTEVIASATDDATTSMYPEVNFSQKSEIAVVASLQARNNARVIVTGSMNVFSDDAFSAVLEHPLINTGSSDNKRFAEGVVGWLTQQRGVIQLKNFSWHKVGGIADVDTDNQLVINDTIEVKFEMEEKRDGKVVPYITDDAQVIFKLNDPVIIRYATNHNNGSYNAIIQTPDKFGVYTLLFSYHRHFLTFIDVAETVPLRTFRLTQSPRVSVGAYPFYAAWMTMLVGFVVFSVVYLNHVPQEASRKQD